jgi:hypothetical protein
MRGYVIFLKGSINQRSFYEAVRDGKLGSVGTV